MKRILILFSLVFMISVSYAYEPVITQQVSGSKNLNCKEMIFISGKPIEMEGTLTVSNSGKNSSSTESYTYKLEDEDGNTLSRQLTFSITSNEKNNGQISKVWELTKFSENITIGTTTYTLEKYDFSRTELDDVKPVGTYFAGNIDAVKTYSDGTDKGKIKITGSGSSYGYNTCWANNEVVNMTYTISGMSGTGENWTGKYKTTTSNTDKKNIVYIENKPTEISFDGGFMISESNVSTLRYYSELPEFYGTKMLNYIVTDEGSSKYESFPVQTRLANYNLKGIKGHWGEQALRQAFALEYMDEWKDNTTPNSGVTRGEFAKIIALALKIDMDNDTKNNTANSSNQKEQQIYKDVPETNEYYKYIMALTEKGVVKGTGNSRFQPNAIISRAEAVTMIITALGFEDKAPEPLPLLNFNDNADIPKWAEKYIYMANKIGLINGDEYGNVMPTKSLTKAEIATITNNMVKYIIEDLGEEYIL